MSFDNDMISAIADAIEQVGELSSKLFSADADFCHAHL